MNKYLVNIQGMHCKSCEMLIEDEVKKIKGVTKVNASNIKGQTEIFSNREITNQAIAQAVRKAGYQIGENSTAIISKNFSDYLDLFLFSGIIFVIVYFLSQTKLLNIGINNSNFSSLLVVLLIGLTAGISTCMALVGGLILSLAAKQARDNPQLSTLEKFQPQIYFNLGRIIGFFILGGIIGYFGAIFKFSNNLIGALTILVSGVMFLLGLQLIGIFPILNRFNLTLPKFVARFFNLKNTENNYSDQATFVLGALTFFLPCGFTQAMQLYAISTGSWERGAVTMAVFALGTTPGLLGIGGLTSLIKGKLAKKFFIFTGIIIIFMAVFNFKNGLNLTDVNLNKVNSGTKIEIKDNYQIIKMTQDENGYTPNSFDLKVGVPVKWIINSVAANSCAASIFVPKLGIKKYLQAGENTIEFTPQEAGTIKFTCAMGMYTGYFTVK